ncbi:uncharacterized protein EI97DRAFT_476259 [Westerdykella ornata]|uniref:Uncharacterized protein n=1 Tax=Westerdykella ornata TaxID=318751 RepID=A0A6A6JFK8_WESOR|nr:uncharacterized protein EI97DRAFT_476259 [Westerdykella ornata]KAF2275117.1 hypothetical protein EI97DRAFT_476259 [Westerdykella ornata]
MPPSSSRRVGLRSRREPEPQPASDADTPDAIATPSRKKRRLNGAERSAVPIEDAPRARITESEVSNDSNATLPDGGDAEIPSDPVERQNLIIAHLRAPNHYTPNAAIDYANEMQARRNATDIAAYAKIAARDWCFFVKKTTLLIGRVDSLVRPHPPSQDSAVLAQGEDMAAHWGVDIDLGPERQISRVHAQIDYDGNDQTWYILVNSRNGLKLDDTTISKGQRVPLHSGICIGIMGTQMLFLLANQQDEFHPMLWRQVKNDGELDGESDKEGHRPSRSLPHAHPGGPTPKREPYDPFPPSSHPRNRHPARSYSQHLTSTPGRPPPGTPMAMHSESALPKGSPSVYPRGMMLDSTEDIDYSHDSAKDIKPPHSYAQLIGQAILSSPEEMLTLANIYQFIKDRYAFFRHTRAGWQNSIRHNLSLSKCFEKVARRTDEPGKGMKWKIVDSERDEFVKKQLLNPRKGGGPVRIDSSGPSSPALNQPPSQATERLIGAIGHGDIFKKHDAAPIQVKSPPRSATPPLNTYPTANESYTPDRGPRAHASLTAFKQSPAQPGHSSLVTPAKRLFQEMQAGGASALHQRSEANGGGAVDIQPSSPNADAKPSVPGLRENSTNSPPTLYSDPAANAANGAGRGLFTPLVSRQAPRLAPPSTAHLPSQYMNLSSPAPFWKYIDLPSTPARQPLDLSPIKRNRDDVEREADDENDHGPVQPSSPPIVGEHSQDPEGKDDEDAADADAEVNEKEEDLAPDSPTRPVSRPASRPASRAHVSATSSQRSRSNSHAHPVGTSSGNGGRVRGASLGSFEELEEEGGFDLAK